ncbi:uncharacterized protein LOC108734482 [Agrilus planipennis]|uniref:Uncharacterized protein LOC108734482 n=1 Tax=Agrilus planipennis TaxID=224129 RepID=A0A1W4WNF9_AGRPL|nr:uncharacterized protein LOC108734482 [Agrilus planipennis]
MKMTTEKDFKLESFLSELSNIYSSESDANLKENIWKDTSFSDIDHAKLLLKCLAKFHATSALYQQKHQTSENGISKACKYFSQEPAEYIKQNGMAIFNELVELSSQFPEIKMKKSEFRKHFEKSLHLISHNEIPIKFQVICCMISPWKQVIFHYQNSRPINCKLTNLTSIFYSSPVYDVLFGIYSMTLREFRKYNLNNLLDYYYKSLENEFLSNDLILKNFLDYHEYQNLVRQFIPQIKLSASLTKYQIIKEYYHLNNNKGVLLDLLEDLEEYFTYKSCRVLPEDVHKIIKSSCGDIQFEIVQYRLESMSKTLGYMGDYSKLIVTILTAEGEKVIKYFAKLFPSNSPFIDTIRDSELFLKEIYMYTDIMDEMVRFGITPIKDCLPQCHLAIHNELLIFEDLNEAGFSTVNHRRVLDIKENAAILKTVSKLHASSIMLEKHIPILETFSYALHDGHYVDDKQKPARISFMSTVNALAYLIGKKFGENLTEFKNYALNLYETSVNLLKPTKKFRNVLSHGDLWPPNFFIKYDPSGIPTDSRLVDFQLIRYTVPAHDVLFAVFFATTHEHRKTFLKHYLDYYYSELINVLKSYNFDNSQIISFDEFLDGCNYILPQVTFQVAAWYQVGQVSPEVMEKINQGGNDIMEIWYKDRRSFCDFAYETDSNYKEKTDEILQTLKLMFEVYKKSDKSKQCQYLKEMYGIH